MAGRLAVRALVQRLDWVNWPMIHWMGEPAPAAPPSPVHAIQARFRSLPPGLYVVRLDKARSPRHYEGFDPLLKALTPAVEEVIPVDRSLIARSLRRLLDARRFPLLLPEAVGDADAWRERCDEAIARARAALDAVGRLDQLASLCLIIGQCPDDLPRPTAAVRALSAWPADVVSEAVRLLGHSRMQRSARTCPELNTPAVAAAVRDVILLRPQFLRQFIDAIPSLLSLHARLADEPQQRLRAAVAIQREAINAAIVECQFSGELIMAFDAASRAGRKRMGQFREAYDRHLAAAMDRHFSPILSAAPKAHGVRTSRRASSNAVAFIAELLAARPLCVVLLGDADRIAGQGRLVGWAQRNGQRQHLCRMGQSEALSFENLTATACDLLWTMARPPEKPQGSDWLLSLAAVDAIPCPPAAADWVESCVCVWPLGPEFCSAVQTTILALHAVYSRASAERRHEAFAALDVAAQPLLRRALGGGHASLASPYHALNVTLFELASLLGQAAAAGIDPQSMCTFIELDGGTALQCLLGRSVREAQAFSAMLQPWVERWTTGAQSPVERRQRLAEWRWAPWQSGIWASAFVILGPGLLQQFLELLAPLVPGHRMRPVSDAIDFVAGESRAGMDLSSLPPVKAMASRRAFLAGAMPLIRSALAQCDGSNAVQTARIFQCFERSMDVTHAMLESQPSLPPEFATPLDLTSALMQSLMHRTRGLPTGEIEHGFYGWLDGKRLVTLVALACGKLDRLLAIGLAIGLAIDHIDWREMGHIEHAWKYLERIEPLQEVISAAAARPGRTQRILRLLARLGLCLSLHRHAQLQKALAALVEPPSPEVDPSAAVQLADEYRIALRELLHCSNGAQPDRIRDILDRPAALARELVALQARASLDQSAQRRRDHVQRILAAPQRLADWIRRDLDKVLPAALDDARLARLEQVAESAVMAHFARILSAPLPAGRNERNWDNALRLYFSTESNRTLLRQLLDHEARGDRDWIRKLPANAKFAREAAAAGVNMDAWLTPTERVIDSPAGPCRIEIETDPLHVLQMGNYFQTCLSEGDFNSFSTIANAIEINKRVIYVYDSRGVVVGRKLIVLTRQGQIVGFRTYGRLPGQPDGVADLLKPALDAFCRELADVCRATLHPCPDSGRLPPSGKADPLVLFAKWYNDGPEPFTPEWLEKDVGERARHTPVRKRKSRR